MPMSFISGKLIEMKSKKQIEEMYAILARTKTILVENRKDYPTTFDLRIADVNAKMSTIDWLFNDSEDIY